MNRFSQFLIFVGLMAIFQSCNKFDERIKQDINISTYQTDSIDYISIINKLGYNINEVEIFDSAFVISNCIYLTKKDLKNYISAPKTKVTFDGILEEQDQHIYLSLWNDDITLLETYNNAIRAWNDLPDCNVLFYNEYDPQFASDSFSKYVDFFIADQSHAIPTQATYKFLMITPIINNVSPKIFINYKNSIWEALSETQKKWAIAHALGILIGLKPSDEPYSIMRSISGIQASDFGSYWSGFSAQDKESLSNKYILKTLNTQINISPNDSKFIANRIYRISPDIEFFKSYSRDELLYDYSITSNSNLDNYTITKYGNGEADISFKCNGKYDITLFVKYNDIIVGSATKHIEINDSFSIPSDITINEYFNISFPCYGTDRMELVALEQYFDNNDSNIEYEQYEHGKFRIKLKDYGQYLLTFNTYNSNDEFLESKQISIRRLYHTTISLINNINPPGYEFLMEPYDIDFICPENMRNLIVESYNPSYTMKVGDTPILQERLYVDCYEKFYRDAFIPPMRVDRRGAVNSAPPVPIIKHEGEDCYIYIPEGRNGYINIESPGWLRYYGYHVAIIPEDSFIIY